MKDEDIFALGVVWVVLTGIVVIFSCIIAWDSGVDESRAQAVEAGVATYEVINAQGDTAFRFLTKEEVCK